MSKLNLKKKNYKQGQAMLVAVVLFLFISVTIILGIATPILKQVKIGNDNYKSKQSYFLANGALEDVFYRLKFGKQVSSIETLGFNGIWSTTTMVNVPGGKQIISISSLDNNVRKMQAGAILGTGISFHYGVQSGNGGFVLQNSSTVTGNIHSSGTITGSGNNIYGDIISSGATGLINNVHATGTAYAHTIQNSTIDKDAYYMTISGSSVGGVSHPGSPDQSPADMPISDVQISQWESDAVAGGTISSCSGGVYTISSNMTIGPKKIPCNLLIKGSGIIVTIAGPLWVAGNITTQTSPTVKMSSSLGSQNVAIIADNPSNTSGSGIITIGQNTVFQGSGSPGSFVFMISQNNSSETGGTTDAIVMGQGASALVAYARHGQITLGQSVGVKEVTAHKIILQNTANVTYDTGLPSTVFQSGPSGGYDLTSWMEVQ